GQIAIATALFDSYGIVIGNDRLYRLRTLEDVAQAIAGVSNAPEKASSSLPSDLEMLPLGDQAETTRALAARFSESPEGAVPLRVVIAASSTAQPLANTMKLWGRAFGLEIDCEFAGFNQISQTLLSPNSLFASNSSGVNVVLVDPTERVFETPAQASAAIDELLNALQQWVSRQPSKAQT